MIKFMSKNILLDWETSVYELFPLNKLEFEFVLKAGQPYFLKKVSD